MLLKQNLRIAQQFQEFTSQSNYKEDDDLQREDMLG